MKTKARAKPAKESNVKKSRKELRKAKRVDKKVKRNEYYTNRNKVKGENSKEVDVKTNKNVKPDKPAQIQSKPKVVRVENSASKEENSPTKHVGNNRSSMASSIAKEKKVEKQLKADMQKRRNKQMIQANWEEDKNIKKLEKQLKLNKRKSKTIPKTFAADGLDYLLEVCDSDSRQNIIGTEMDVDHVNNDFEEDFNLMMGNTNTKKAKNKPTKDKKIVEESTWNIDDESDCDINNFEEEEELDEAEEYMNVNSSMTGESENSEVFGYDDSDSDDDKFEVDDDDSETDEDDPIYDLNDFNKDSEDYDEDNKVTEPETKETKPINTWEDIYGRLRDKDGKVVTDKEVTTTKYVPPAQRAALAGTDTSLLRLKRQLKGLINRLAESNMHNIASQIEALYGSNSRHNMNETLASIMFENIIVTTPCPERLLLEHVLLVTILHANVGSEVGAFFLQTVAQRFSKLLQDYVDDVEDKRIDNAVNFIAQLYNFKLFSSQLLYEILTKLAETFEEKHVECILNVLKNVGFTLRKDDPSTLKTLIQELQAKATSDLTNNNPRVKFMLEILLAIKNNNVNKIPNYDTSYSEHLKKISKPFIRKGNYVTQLNISLEDLLKADEQGKWWVVGSAWAGKTGDSRVEKTTTEVLSKNVFSQKLLALAKKQHMNTETRMNIFCILMSAEDYMDAFEKILHLGLKNQQERDIINVLLHCCLSEKAYNPYYSVLAQKFCDYDRKFQMIIKCSIWDKLQTLVDCSPAQISNLAKLLTHLFLEKGLPISTLKIVRFGELDKVTLRFMRQILLGVMLTPDAEQCQEVFLKVCHSDKLKMFRDSLRLFIHHFLLRNLRKEGESNMDEKQKTLLEERAKMLDKLLLSANDRKRKLSYDD